MKYTLTTILRSLCFCVGVFAFIPTGYAAASLDRQVLQLNDESEAFRVNAQKEALAYFEVPESINAENIAAVVEQKIVKNSTVAIPNFVQQHTYGLYISVYNNTDTPDWVVHLNRFLIDEVSVYVVADGVYKHYSANFRDGSQNQSIESVFGRGVPISLPLGSTANVLVLLSSDTYVPPVSVDFYGRDKYERVTEDANVFFIFTLGIVFTSIAASLVCFVLLRETTFFWFAISSFCMGVITLSRSYLGIIFLGPGNELPEWFWLLICVAEVSLLKFVISFLSADKDPPSLSRFYNKSFVLISICIFTSLLLSELFLPAEKMVMISIFYGLLIALIAMILGVIYAFKQRGYYILFSLGWLPIFFRIGEKAFTLNIDPNFSSDAIMYNPSYDPVYQAIHFFIHLSALVLRFADHKKQQVEAETKSLAKTMFLASVSHDLRQPIHSMQLLTSHLEGEVQSQQGKSILNQLQLAQNSFDTTFNSLMDWSQLEAGKVSVNLEKVDIRTLLHNVKAEFTSLALQKGIELRVQSSPYVVTTDPLLLSRILRNLLSNALKYTQSGGVLMTVRCRKNSILIEVWDTGCGIAEQDQPIIFDLYQRAKHYKELVSGSGIGLANVKQLVDVLGYKISLKSRLNSGSVFRIEIPDVVNCREQKKNQSREGLSILSIANLVEDAELKQTVNNYLHKWGYTTITATDIKQDDESHCIYFTDVSSNILGFLAKKISRIDVLKSRQFVGSFSTVSLKDEVIDKLEIHRLNPCVEPAELRAFIRYVEAQYLSI